MVKVRFCERNLNLVKKKKAKDAIILIPVLNIRSNTRVEYSTDTCEIHKCV